MMLGDIVRSCNVRKAGSSPLGGQLKVLEETQLSSHQATSEEESTCRPLPRPWKSISNKSTSCCCRLSSRGDAINLLISDHPLHVVTHQNCHSTLGSAGCPLPSLAAAKKPQGKARGSKTVHTPSPPGQGNAHLLLQEQRAAHRNKTDESNYILLFYLWVEN